MNLKKNLLLWLLALGALLSCQKEASRALPQVDVLQEEDIRIKLNIPVSKSVTTYAMTAKQECEILTVDVLVYDAGGSQKFLYRQKGTAIADGTADNEKSFSVKIEKTATPSRVKAMVIANCRAQVDSALASKNTVPWLNSDTSWEETVQKLVFELPVDETSENEGGKWLVLPGRYTRFPMWGETGDIDLNAASITIPEVQMMRAVARIDVGLNFATADGDVASGIAGTTAGTSKFFLEEIYLYNASDKLHIASSHISAGDVTAPMVPSDAGVYGTADAPIVYKVRPWNTRKDLEFVREIYLAEHAAGSDTDRPNNCCIVVGGRYAGAAGIARDTYSTTPNSAGAITYYRIDFVKTEYDTDGNVTAQEYIPILRNHRYRVNITDVHGRGYDTPRAAFDAMGINTNLTVNIASEDDNVNAVVYDGQYMLGVPSREVVFGGPAERLDQELWVNTNYPEGFKASRNVAWINFDNGEGEYTAAIKTGTAGGTSIKYAVQVNNTGAMRQGIITLQAGRLFQYVTITQHATNDIVISKPTHYIMAGTSYPQRLDITARYPWKARIDSDEYNIILSFPKEGAAGTTNGTMTFVDDQAIQRLYDKNATMTIYSETGQFEPYTFTVRARRHYMLNATQEVRFMPYVVQSGERFNQVMGVWIPSVEYRTSSNAPTSFDFSTYSSGGKCPTFSNEGITGTGTVWRPLNYSEISSFVSRFYQDIPNNQIKVGGSTTYYSYEARTAYYIYSSEYHIFRYWRGSTITEKDGVRSYQNTSSSSSRHTSKPSKEGIGQSVQHYYKTTSSSYSSYLGNNYSILSAGDFIRCIRTIPEELR